MPRTLDANQQHHVYALDVALLLPPILQRRIIRLNSMLSRPPDGFLFNKYHLPHITLSQFFVTSANYSACKRTITSIVDNFGPISIRTGKIIQGRTASTVEIEPNKSLLELHAQLMDQLQNVESHVGNHSAFSSHSHSPRPADVRWVKHFRSRAAYNNFSPHVTVGIGHLSRPCPPTHVLATTIATCHLGRFCTCARVFDTWTLTVTSV